MIRSISRILRSNNTAEFLKKTRPASWAATNEVEQTEPVGDHVLDDELVSGIPDDVQAEHVAIIFKPAPSATQIGKSKYDIWKIKFPAAAGERKEYYNPLMVPVLTAVLLDAFSYLQGWTSTTDAMNMVTLDFANKEDAIAYATRNGWPYEVEEPHEFALKPKNYGSNFQWQKPPRDYW